MPTKHTPEHLAALKAALDHIRAQGVEAWDLLAYAMADCADADAATTQAEDPDCFDGPHTGLDELILEIDCECDDPSMGVNLLRDACAIYRQTHSLPACE